MITSPLLAPVRSSPSARRFTQRKSCAGDSEMLGSSESIHNGSVLGVSFGGKRYVRMSVLGMLRSGWRDLKGILSRGRSILDDTNRFEEIEQDEYENEKAHTLLS